MQFAVQFLGQDELVVALVEFAGLVPLVAFAGLVPFVVLADVELFAGLVPLVELAAAELFAGLVELVALDAAKHGDEVQTDPVQFLTVQFDVRQFADEDT